MKSSLGGTNPSPSTESAGALGPPPQGYLPDPPALSMRAQWRYLIRYDRGAIRTDSPRALCLDQPRATARRLGRFALELWVGFELVERVRFNFPLLAAEPPPAKAVPGEGQPRRAIREPPRFAPGARVSIPVLVPASPRATRARILDRATGDSTEVPWPPESGSSGAPIDSCAEASPLTDPAPDSAG